MEIILNLNETGNVIKGNPKAMGSNSNKSSKSSGSILNIKRNSPSDVAGIKKNRAKLKKVLKWNSPNSKYDTESDIACTLLFATKSELDILSDKNTEESEIKRVAKIAKSRYLDAIEKSKNLTKKVSASELGLGSMIMHKGKLRKYASYGAPKKDKDGNFIVEVHTGDSIYSPTENIIVKPSDKIEVSASSDFTDQISKEVDSLIDEIF